MDWRIMKDPWRVSMEFRIALLRQDRHHIMQLHRKLSAQGLLNHPDIEAAIVDCLTRIDQDIEGIKWDLHLDEMLESELPIEEWIKRYD